MKNDYLELAVREVWQQQHPVGLDDVARARHLYLVGQTGTGKSTLISNLVRQDIERGEGVTLIDPHGDLVEAVYDYVPRHRIDDVVIVDPTDHAHVPGFNPFYRVPVDDRPRVTSNLVSTFKHVWSDSWGPRLEHILRNAVRLVLDAPDRERPTFIAVARVLVERDYRERLLCHCTDAQVEQFWRDEFGAWNQRFITEALAPVQNKLGAVLASPFVRNILGQWKPTIDLAKIIADQKILIVRLPKGTVGEDNANLLGSMMVSGLMHAAMAPRKMRVRHHLFIDEFQSFTSESFATSMSEARKFNLTLTIAHQFTDQLAPVIRSAVFGNVGTIVSFRVGAVDADRLAHEYSAREFPPARFADLKRGQVLIKLMGEGGMPVAMLAQTRLPERATGQAAKVIHQSRRAFAKPRDTVEKNMGRWLAG